MPGVIKSLNGFNTLAHEHWVKTGRAATCVYLGVDEIAGLKAAFKQMSTVQDHRLKEVFAWKGVPGEANAPLFVMGIEVFAVNRQTHCRFVTVMEPKA